MRLPKLSALFLTTAMAMGVAGTAQAADIGECGTPEAMTAKLKAEDQRSIASAQRVQTVNGIQKLTGIIFTSSSDRSVGYILQADKPIGEKASQICVYNRVAGIRFADARKSGVPESVLLKATNAEALKKCSDLVKDKKIPTGSCLPLNEAIQKGEPLGQRVMFQAFNVKKQSDGSYKADGTLTTVTGNVNGSVNDDAQNPGSKILGDILYSSLSDGATVVSAILVYPKYTDYGLLALEQSP